MVLSIQLPFTYNSLLSVHIFLFLLITFLCSILQPHWLLHILVLFQWNYSFLLFWKHNSLCSTGWLLFLPYLLNQIFYEWSIEEVRESESQNILRKGSTRIIKSWPCTEEPKNHTWGYFPNAYWAEKMMFVKKKLPVESRSWKRSFGVPCARE